VALLLASGLDADLLVVCDKHALFVIHLELIVDRHSWKLDNSVIRSKATLDSFKVPDH
jgi:exosome complex RNA-binding protein Rrp42 (RNase PH superfamily)